MLDHPISANSATILAAPDYGGIDGLAHFGFDFLVDSDTDELFASAAGVAFGHGTFIFIFEKHLIG